MMAGYASMADVEVPAPVEGLRDAQEEWMAEVKRVASRLAEMICESGYERKGIQIEKEGISEMFRAHRDFSWVKDGEKRVMLIFRKTVWKQVPSYQLRRHSKRHDSYFHDHPNWDADDCLAFSRAVEAGYIEQVREHIEKLKDEMATHTHNLRRVW